MDSNTISYVVGGALIISWLLQHNIFVKPADLEKKHREILEEADKKITAAVSTKASKDEVARFSSELSEIKGKIDKIYDHLISSNNKLV